MIRISNMLHGKCLKEPSEVLVRSILSTLLIVFAIAASAQEKANLAPRRGVALDARDAHGLTSLVKAASAGDTEGARSLLSQGASVDASAADGRTPLIAAVATGKIETVQALIAAGADLNRAARGSGTALNVAENKGLTQIASLLVASGAHTTGKSVGDTVCVRPWGGDGFCGVVKSFSVPSVQIQVSKVVGCANGCEAKSECSADRIVGGASGLQAGEQVAVPSWCLTQTGVKP